MLRCISSKPYNSEFNREALLKKVSMFHNIPISKARKMTKKELCNIAHPELLEINVPELNERIYKDDIIRLANKFNVKLNKHDSIATVIQKVITHKNIASQYNQSISQVHEDANDLLEAKQKVLESIVELPHAPLNEINSYIDKSDKISADILKVQDTIGKLLDKLTPIEGIKNSIDILSQNVKDTAMKSLTNSEDNNKKINEQIKNSQELIEQLMSLQKSYDLKLIDNLKKVTNDIADIKSTIPSLEKFSQHEILNNKVSTLEDKIKEKENEIKELQNKLAVPKSNAIDNKANEILKQEIESLKNDNANMKEKIQNLINEKENLIVQTEKQNLEHSQKLSELENATAQKLKSYVEQIKLLEDNNKKTQKNSDEIKKLEDKITENTESYKLEKERLENQIKDNVNLINKYTTDIDRLNNEKENVKKDLENLVHAKEQEILELDKKMKESNDQYKKLEQDTIEKLNDANEKIKVLQSDLVSGKSNETLLQEKQAEIERLKNMAEEKLKEFESKEATYLKDTESNKSLIEKLELQIEDYIKKSNEKDLTIAEKQKRIDVLQKLVDDNEVIIKDQSNKIKSHDELIKENNDLIQKLKDEINDQRSKQLLLSTNDEIKVMKSIVEEKEQANKILQEDMNKTKQIYEDKISQLQQDKDSLIAQVNLLNAELESLKKNNIEETKQIKQLEEQIDNTKKDLGLKLTIAEDAKLQSEKKYENLQEEYNKNIETLEKLQKDHVISIDTINKLNDQNNKIQEELVEINKEKDILEKSLHKSTDAVKAEEQINKLASEKQTLLEELTSTKNNLQEVTNELNNIKKEGDPVTMKKDLEILEKEKEKLSQEFGILKDDYMTISKDKQQLENKYKGVNIEQITNRMQELEKDKENIVSQLVATKEEKESIAKRLDIVSKELDNIKNAATAIQTLPKDISEGSTTISQSDVEKVNEITEIAKEVKIVADQQRANIKTSTEPNILLEYRTSKIEDITEDLINQINQIRNDNSQLFLKSTGIDLDILPIIFKLVKHDENGVQPKTNVEKLLSALKSTMAATRLLTRNPLSIRLSGLSDEDFNIVIAENNRQQIREMLHDLYYIQIPLIESKVSELKEYRSGRIPKTHNNVLRKILGDTYYTKFLWAVCNDSTTEIPTIKVETMLEALVDAMNILVKKRQSEFTEYADIFAFSAFIIKETINKNKARVELENMIYQMNRKELIQLHNEKNSIFTFVKMRSDQQISINKRFKVALDENSQILQIDYSNYQGPFYDKENNMQELDVQPVYTDHFVFGPFTKVFRPHETNEMIANDSKVQELLDRLRNLKPIVLIGYGASGSGKTSTLVNLKTFKNGMIHNEPGVLVHLIRQAADVFTDVDVSMIELEGDIKSNDPVKDVKILPPKDDASDIYNPQHFLYKNGEWIIDFEPLEKESEKTTESGKSAKAKIESLKKYDVGSSTPLGDYIVSLMDKRRSVQATTNNPESSRSHVIIFIKCTNKEGKSTYLIVCDFAGVENKFDCSNQDILNAFIAIKTKDQSKLFYKERIDEEVNRITNGKTLEEVNKAPKLDELLWEKIIKDVDIDTINNGIVVIDKLYANRNPKTKLSINTPSALATLKTTKEFSIILRIINVLSNSSFLAKTEDFNKLSKSIDKIMSVSIDKKGKKIPSQFELLKNTISSKLGDSASIFVSKMICADRVKEGLFINDSLYNLRLFISWFLKTIVGAKGVPSFTDMCLPMQCNPYTNECFGIGGTTIAEEPYSIIANQMKQTICGNNEVCNSFKDLTFVVFNVLHLSHHANNPPPIEYTDISGLIQEYNRLKSLKLYDESLLNDGLNFLSNEPRVRQFFINDLKSRETISRYDETTKTTLMKLITDLETSANSGKPVEEQITRLKTVIDFCTNINAVSAIGTMEFTDMIAKFGINTNICNFRTDSNIVTSLNYLPEVTRDAIISSLDKQREDLAQLVQNEFSGTFYKQE